MKDRLVMKVFLLLFALFIIYEVFKAHNDKNRLLNQGLISKGKIISANADYRGRLSIIYIFELDSRAYKNTKGYPSLYIKGADYFVGKTFPVLYYPNNVDINTILITREDFKKYNIKFPDSLNWVLDYEK